MDHHSIDTANQKNVTDQISLKIQLLIKKNTGKQGTYTDNGFSKNTTFNFTFKV